MNSILFPKPPPADPLPLDIWLDRTDRAEVGREPFFRGRDAEYETFRNTVKSLNAGQIGGGTMVFQGAPGAGKTALMMECMEAARQHSTPEDPWVAVAVEANTLNSATGVVRIMIEEATREQERLSVEFPGRVSRSIGKLKNIGQKRLSDLTGRTDTVSAGGMDVTMHGKSEGIPNPGNPPAELVFRDASPVFEGMRLVIFVDEAQNVPVGESTKGIINCLHKSSQGIPLVTAFSAWAIPAKHWSNAVFRGCPETGQSRWTLSRTRIQGMRYNTSLTPIISRVLLNRTWVDALIELSQGWPQHVNNVSIAAGRVARDHEGSINERLLSKAIELGRERKEEYYAYRLDACSGDPWIYRQLALAAWDRDGVLSWYEIDSLSRFARSLRGQSTDEFLIDAIHAGILTEVKRLPKHYELPIPSLGEYLRALPVVPPPEHHNKK